MCNTAHTLRRTQKMFASTAALVFVPIAVLTAYVVFGLSGFGSTLISVPLLPFLLAGMVIGATILVSAPPGILLALLGDHWHTRITRAQAMRSIGAALTLSGASLLLRAL